MRVKIHSSEMNRMMNIIKQCIDPRFQDRGNIEIIYDNNLLSIRSTNGQFSAVVMTPVLGATGETFCVDGTMFAKVCAMCNGEIEISTDEKTCTIKGAGRTRLPIMNCNIPLYTAVDGNVVTIPADSLNAMYKGVSYAISDDQTRVQLTGILAEATDSKMKFVALDGFQMSIESSECNGNDMNVIIPGAFMKLITQGTITGEDVKIRTDGKCIEAITDGMKVSATLLSGQFPDYNRITPSEFSTECLVKVDELRNALRCGSVVGNLDKNPVRLEISESSMKVMGNSAEADYEADVACDTHGPGLKIAFNQKYLMNTINAINTEEAILKFNSSVAPCIVQGKDSNGIHLLLPVRVVG